MTDCTCSDFRNTDLDGHDSGCPEFRAVLNPEDVRISIVPDEFPSVEILRLQPGDIVIAKFSEAHLDEEDIRHALESFGRALAMTGHAKDCAVMAMPDSVMIEVLRKETP